MRDLIKLFEAEDDFDPDDVCTQAAVLLMQIIAGRGMTFVSELETSLPASDVVVFTVGNRPPEWAVDECRAVLAQLEDNTWGEGLLVWQVVKASATWTPETQRPSRFWSWTEPAVEEYWKHGGSGAVEWVQHGQVGVMDVDWPMTIALNADPMLRNEQIVRVRDGGRVHVLWYQKVNDTGSRINLTKLINPEVI